MQLNPVGWFEIYVDDMARARAFYETVLAVSLEQLNVEADMNIEMWAFPSSMENYGASGALAKMEGVPAGGNSVMVYFSCEDCATEQSRVEAAGGKVVQPKFSIGEHGFISIAADSEGNMIGLHSMA